MDIRIIEPDGFLEACAEADAKSVVQVQQMNPEPFRNVPPGHIIRREMEARGWDIYDLAVATGISEIVLDLILGGEERITPKFAGQLADIFGTSRDIWLKLEFNYRSREGEGGGT